MYRRPGRIDARVTGAENGLKYALVAPRSDPRAIHLRYEGADRIAVTDGGELTIEAGDRTIIDGGPFAYQHVDGRTVSVDVRFVLRGADVGFSLGRYDRSLPLVIDPTLVYSTYLGSSGYDAGRAIAVDASGSAYVVGTTRGLDFPTTPGSYQPTFRGGSGNFASDAFVAKLNTAGTAFEYVTYLGGRDNDEAFGVAVDAAGQVYVTGYTESDDFPSTGGAFRSRSFSHHDGFRKPTALAPGSSTRRSSARTGRPIRRVSPSTDATHATGRTFAENVPVPPERLSEPQRQGDGFS